MANEIKDRLLTGLKSGNLTRRHLLQIMAASGVALLPGSRSSAQQNLQVLSWSGYDIPDMAPAFFAAHGAPSFSLMGSDEEGFQKVRAGYRPDLAHHTSFIVGKYKDAGLIKPVDENRLEHLSDFFPELVTAVTIDGQLWQAPVSWGNSSVIYRKDLVEVTDESWGLLWDERYAGRLAARDSMEGLVVTGGLYVGASDPWAMTDEELEATRVALIRQKPLLRFYWSSQTDLEQAFANGEIVAAYGWNASVAMLRKQGIDMGLLKVKEGIITWSDGLVIMDGGSGSDDLAYEFINAYMSPEVGAFLINSYGYGSGNSKAFSMVSEDRLMELGIGDPSAVISSSRFQRSISPELQQKYQAVFDEVKLS